jgi:hypothetical protein
MYFQKENSTLFLYQLIVGLGSIFSNFLSKFSSYFFKLYNASFPCCSLISNCFSYFIFTHLQPQQIQYLFLEFSSSKGDFSIVSVT